jgi:hypothetical protein
MDLCAAFSARRMESDSDRDAAIDRVLERRYWDDEWNQESRFPVHAEATEVSRRCAALDQHRRARLKAAQEARTRSRAITLWFIETNAQLAAREKR